MAIHTGSPLGTDSDAGPARPLADGTARLFAAAGLEPPRPAPAPAAPAAPAPASATSATSATSGGDGGLPAARGPGAPTAAMPVGALAGLDVWRLAGLLIPDLGRGQRDKLARELGVPLPSDEPADPAARQSEAEAIVAACAARLTALDISALQRLSTIFAGSRLPEAAIVQHALRERARAGFDPAAARTGGDAETDEAALAAFTTPPPLRPGRTRHHVDQADVVRALSPAGAVAAVLAGYEARAGQVKMARAVTKALNEQLHLVVEAGTGVGKSLAYLVPSVLYATANGRRVVVSTNTINLQEQLFAKDIPLVRRALPQEFRAAVLKGRSNYLCLRRWRTFLRESLQSEADRLLAAKVFLWLRRTETGDRTELALDDAESARWYAALAADALHCTPQLCKDNRAGRCFLSRARRRAEAAHLLVVNHALLLADQALESRVLPPYADLIVDEAHHLEDVATDQLGVTIDHQELGFFLTTLSQQQGPGRYAGLVSRVMTVLVTAGGAPMRSAAGEITQPAHDAVEEVRRRLHELFGALQQFVASLGNGPMAGERDIRLVPAVRQTPAWEVVETCWQSLAKALGDAESGLARIVDALEPYKGSSDLVDDAVADLAGAQRELMDVRVHLSQIVSHPDSETVCWVAVRDRGVSLRAAPLEVGTLLQQHLFSEKDCVVLTSATIQVDDSFRHIRDRLGLEPRTYSLAVPSPFDYPSQALLCVPDDLPEPTSPAFGQASLRALAAICEATRGRTLVLFTSHAALRAACDHLRRRLRGVAVIGQGLDGPRGQLLERFRSTPNCILLGTSSFWEGIDVVGDALSCLVIVKLPFSVPSDPVFAARSELLENPFGQYAIPQAVLRLKQGFGRLIRSTTDRGVVAILDSRLFTKRYGRTFLRSLPPATLKRCATAELAPTIKSWLDDAGR